MTDTILPPVPEATPASVVGKTIRTIREARGWTQAQLARAVPTHRPLVARIESGRHAPSIPTVCQYAKALDVPPSQLLAGLDEGW